MRIVAAAGNLPADDEADILLLPGRAAWLPARRTLRALLEAAPKLAPEPENLERKSPYAPTQALPCPEVPLLGTCFQTPAWPPQKQPGTKRLH